MTHHVDLVLPGAFYLVRMLDGRIDIQDTIANLKVQGLLEGIELDAAVDAYEEELVDPRNTVADEVIDDDAQKVVEKTKKPRKLVKDEYREVGGVKWSVYKSYLKASYVTRQLFEFKYLF